MKPIFKNQRAAWGLAVFTFIVLAAQCQAPAMPPTPAPPVDPVVRIALLSPASGELATFGRIMRNGSVMAFDRWNEQGGLLGHQIEWTIYDTGCQFEAARQAAQAALADGFQFIVGPLCSEAAIAAAELAETAEALMISPTATHPLVTVDHRGQTRPTIFRASYSYALQGQAVARFAYDILQVDQAALFFYPGDNYSTTLADAFADQFSRLGGEVVYRAGYTPGDIDFSERLWAIDQAGAEVIYLPAMPAVVNRIATQLREMNSSASPVSARTNPILLGSDSWESPELDRAITRGNYFATHFIMTDEQPAVINWVEDYRSTYAIEPDALAALGYDAALMLTTAIDRAGTFETPAVAAALAEGTFDGVTGQTRFDQQHNPVKPVSIVRIEPETLKFYISISVDPLALNVVNSF
jgi:branched-chain amino acid transport system substrate-binding protein